MSRAGSQSGASKQPWRCFCLTAWTGQVQNTHRAGLRDFCRYRRPYKLRIWNALPKLIVLNVNNATVLVRALEILMELGLEIWTVRIGTSPNFIVIYGAVSYRKRVCGTGPLSGLGYLVFSRNNTNFTSNKCIRMIHLVCGTRFKLTISLTRAPSHNH